MTEQASSIAFSSSLEREGSPLERFSRHFDWVLFSAILVLTCLGLVMVYSASLRFGHPELYLGKQSLAFLIGFFSFFLMATLNYQIFNQNARALFMISIFLLLLVIFAGTTHRGTKAWFNLGFIAFQPAEICKLFVILILASWCDKHTKEIKQFKMLAIPFLVVLAHIFLILLQPDFGSTLIYFPILLGILFAAGARAFHLCMLLFYGLFSAGVVLLYTALALAPVFLDARPFWNYIYRGMSLGKESFFLLLSLAAAFALGWWFLKQLRFRVPIFYFVCTFLLVMFGWFSSSMMAKSIKGYQRQRLLVFFQPGIDPLGSGYHVNQSVVALGSGKIFGKGLFSGTQGRLGFLPEQHTDFIFSVLGEELGFLASGFVILLYLILIWRCYTVAEDSRDRFGALVAVGIGSMFTFYAVLNLAMVMGMAPITGLPIPFLSYGGSALVSSWTAAGILLSIYVRRYTH